MIFATSDLHGVHPDVLDFLMQKAGVTGDDTIYILGDVIDRGEYGIELLQKISEMKNARMILGNHESMFLSALYEIDPLLFSDADVSSYRFGQLALQYDDPIWLHEYNGGGVTMEHFNLLRYEQKKKIVDFLLSLELFTAVEIGEMTFVLTHSGISGFDPNKSLDEYRPDKLLWSRPQLFDKFYCDEHKKMVFGHTPTNLYGEDFGGRILFAPDFIDLDTGSGHGGTPSVICLDNLKCTYVFDEKSDEFV